MRKLLIGLFALALLAGCQRQFDMHFDQEGFRVRGDTVFLSARGSPDAELRADGSLRIDGRRVQTTPEQAAALGAFHAEVIAFADAAVDMGKQAGSAVATATREAVREGLRGNGAEVRGRIEADVKSAVEESLGALCARMERLHEIQQEVLDAGLEAFAPYARMGGTSPDRCRERLARQ